MRGSPKSRLDNILVQEMQNALLIYDLKINKAFSLNETCAMVWRECDGEKTILEIASILAKKTNGLINEEVVWLALDTLKKENLLDEAFEFDTHFDGLNRRQLIRKVGFASMVAIPVITSLIAPLAANAASGGICPGGNPPTTPFFVGSSLPLPVPSSCSVFGVAAYCQNICSINAASFLGGRCACESQNANFTTCTNNPLNPVNRIICGCVCV